MKVQDSVAFVTGANRGLGLAFARELIARGAKTVYAGVRNPSGLDVPGLVRVKLDVTDPASVSAAAAECSDVSPTHSASTCAKRPYRCPPCTSGSWTPI